MLAERGLESALVGDEGGYGPKLRDNEHALEIVVDAMLACGLEPGRDVAIALDIASSHFFDPISGTYRLATAGTQALDSSAMIDLLAGWVERYPILSIEDGLAEDDWAGWTRLTEALGGKVQLIGDDLFATQSARLAPGDRRQGRQRDPDQGQPGRDARARPSMPCSWPGGTAIVPWFRPVPARPRTPPSPTCAVATAAGQIKIGSVARSERLAKYNRLLRIEEMLGPAASFAGDQTAPRTSRGG